MADDESKEVGTTLTDALDRYRIHERRRLETFAFDIEYFVESMPHDESPESMELARSVADYARHGDTWSAEERASLDARLATYRAEAPVDMRDEWLEVHFLRFPEVHLERAVPLDERTEPTPEEQEALHARLNAMIRRLAAQESQPPA